MILKCHPHLQHVFPLMLHLPLWGMECAMGNRFDHVDSHCSHMKQGFLCHEVITFRAMIWCLGFIQHTEMRNMKHCILYSFVKGKKNIKSVHSQQIFLTKGFHFKVRLVWHSEQKEMFCGCLRYIFYYEVAFGKWETVKGSGKWFRWIFIFYRKTTKKTTSTEIKDQDKP